MDNYIISLDAMGGDNAPGAIVKGAVAALREYRDISVRLYGQQERIRSELEDAADVQERIQVIDARQVIDMNEAPMMAVRQKPDSSMVRAMLSLKEGEAGAVVSAGSTGALLACGMLRVGRIRGIERPALGPVIPGTEKPWMLIDSGANVDCTAKYLLHFGMMGSVYMQNVMNVPEPQVGLVNIGTESEKGNRLAKEAYALMTEQNCFCFAGNCEAREIPTGRFDVVVADGFDGNIILKYTEGLSRAMNMMLKESLMKSARGKIGALLAKPAFRDFKSKLDYNVHGGAPLLGIEGSVIKAHGSSGEQAIKNAIRQARTMLVGHVTEKIKEGMEQLNS